MESKVTRKTTRMVKICKGQQIIWGKHNQYSRICLGHLEDVCDHFSKPEECPLDDEEYKALPEISAEEVLYRIIHRLSCSCLNEEK